MQNFSMEPLKLLYFDGYFMHHVLVYAQLHKEVFLPIIHKSGRPPMIAGGLNTIAWQAPYWPNSPIPDEAKTFGTAEEATKYAKQIADETIGAYCRDFPYR
jgi:hypothetical protein